MQEELLLIPGPTALDPRVIQTLVRPQIGHLGPEMHEAFIETLELTKYVFGGGHPIVFTGSGTVAMEAAVLSLVEPGEKVLVCVNGYFGDRFAELNRIHGADVKELKPDVGKPALPADVRRELVNGGYKAVFMTHVETSTGLENPILDLVAEARRHGVFTVVDSVAGLAGCRLDFEELGADIVLTGAQKAIASIPGAAILSVSDRAVELFEMRKTPIRSYYMNLLRWKKVMDDPKIYLATPAVQVILALREALRIVKAEGLEKRWVRHRIIAEAFREGIQAAGLRIIAQEGYRSNTVTAFYTPEENAPTIQETMKTRFGVHIATGLGPLKKNSLRIGHFGNISARDTASALSALEMTLRIHGVNVKPGAALDSALPILEKLPQ